ncbi:unnamed protein product [marine sediment metagenome]|uniref:Uncharacterized protein n=1 Tax=marine sediment metagenome TaxID=412755 RepID=X1SH66_9ZZZZ
MCRNSATFRDSILPSLKPFFREDKEPTLQEFLGLTDYVVLAQVSEWKNAEDGILSDLTKIFFARGDGGFKVAFDSTDELPMVTKIWEKENNARKHLQGNNLDPEYYLLKDEFDVEVYKPYAPESETEEMSPENVIMLSDDSPEANIREISNVLTRLKPIAKKLRTARYYCPEEHKEVIKELLS